MDASDELRSLEATGIYRLAGSPAAFVDPVRLLGESYRRFRLVPSAYYSRSFGPSRQGGEGTAPSPDRKKRKRKRQPKPRELNAVERIAEARHQKPLGQVKAGGGGGFGAGEISGGSFATGAAAPMGLAGPS
ncbi:hypothetical protein TRIUR3_07165 [Triticum urartu]|uniref:Uncharacterized protein n=1 Tax=Triticum urartu TaxID=4572 RepID=M7Z0V5_TRIUA|nr:hypothetical protein TRIUR3_07165 [Triticum urartu]